MENNDKQNLTQEQLSSNPPPSTLHKKLSKKITVIAILAIIAGVVVCLALTLQPKADLSPITTNHVSPTPAVTTPAELIKSSPGLTLTQQELISKVKPGLSSYVPVEWGQIQNVVVFVPGDYQTPDTYEVSFTNQVTAYFRPGTNSILYKKVTGTYPCPPDEDISNYADSWICNPEIKNYNTYEYYLYNLTTKNTADLGNNSIPSTFNYTELNSNNITKMVFSPKGNFINVEHPCFQGCWQSLLDANTGKEIYSGPSLTLSFSGDENIIAIRDDCPMNGAEHFVLIDRVSNKTYNILQALNSDENSCDLNLKSNILLTKINNSSVDFVILKPSDTYQAGAYHYDFATQKITLIK